jgi:hypothetical protein
MKIISELICFESSIRKSSHHLNPANHDHLLLLGSLLNSGTLVLLVLVLVPASLVITRFLLAAYRKTESGDRMALLHELARLERR